MKTEIKIDRIKNKIVKLEEELAGLRSSISGEWDISKRQSAYGDELPDHLVTRGAKY